MRQDRRLLFFNRDARQKMLQQMAKEELDVLVIGGGITGCGILLDIRLRGLRAGLVEMQDYGAGTSSRSTKLIHGGLRYLKQGDFKLVRQVGRERAILYKNAPHIVTPEWLLLPLYEGGSLGKWSTSLGLWLYDFLANVSEEERRRMLDKEAALVREPLLAKQGLLGAGLYVEYRTDDARLTLEVVKTAVQEGALAANYAKVTSFIYEEGQIRGVKVEDLEEHKTYTIRAKSVVNAAGPWVDDLRREDNSLYGKKLHLSKGIHIVIDGSRFPLRQAVYFDTPDGRMIFAIPREGKTYVGTTDTSYVGDIMDPPTEEEEISYLLEASRSIFPRLSLQRSDIEAYWAGIRPLIHKRGRSSTQLSRKDELIISPSGLISIAGGKLTGYRKMAEKVVQHIINRNFPGLRDLAIGKPNPTEHTMLIGGKVGGPEKWYRYKDKMLVHLQGLGISKSRAAQLLDRYGSETMQMLSYLVEARAWCQKNPDLVNEDLQHNMNELSLLAEFFFSVEEEMVIRADDFLTRRTGLSYFEKQKSVEWTSIIAHIMGDEA